MLTLLLLSDREGFVLVDDLYWFEENMARNLDNAMYDRYILVGVLYNGVHLHVDMDTIDVNDEVCKKFLRG